VLVAITSLQHAGVDQTCFTEVLDPPGKLLTWT
jgi:hypothetical protein